jgi:IS30 family transposase
MNVFTNLSTKINQAEVCYTSIYVERKNNHKRAGIYETRGRFSTAPSIDDRPSIVDERVRLGDWELDTVFGVPSSASLVSMVDRTSRIARFIKVNTRKSDIVSAVIIEQLRALNRPVHSLTSDNGKEFSQYQTMAKELGTDFILPTLTLLGSVEPMKIPMDC